MAILVTGGAGYIGSHTVVELQNAGYDVVVLDNLSNASEKSLERVSKITGKPVKFYKADILDRDALNEIFDKEEIDSCIHFAGLKAVGESVAKPWEYYENNIAGTLTLVDVMRKHNVNVQKRKKHYTVGAILWLIVEYVSLIFFGLCAVVPVISCVITAFKTQEEYQTTNVMTLPKNWLNFDNFIKAFQTADMGRAFLNSVIVMVSVLVVSIVIGTQLAYVLNRFKFPGNGLIRNLFLFASLLPAVAMQVTVYNIMTALHFVNHLYGYIILMCGTDVISIYIFIQFMENIPISLDESAIIDGASYWTIYWKIMLPLLKPAIVTSCILKGVGVYNEYYMANLYLMDKKLHTIATSLYTFVGPMGSQYNLICAGVIISLLPALIVFILCQKQIYSGIAAGAVKG